MLTQSKKCQENPQQNLETSNLHIKPTCSKNTQQGSGKKAIPQVGPKTNQHEEVKSQRKSNAARSRRRCIVEENDSPTKSLMSKFQPITNVQNAAQQENQTPNTSEIVNTAKPQMMPDGARGRRLRKLMIEQNCPRYGGMTAMRKKEIIHEPEEIQELNEVIEKRCCICLEEMKAKTRPEECSHVFCRTCITAWTDTFSNLCPLCKIEIKFLLIYKERPDFEEGCEESIENDAQYNTVVDKIKVTKPVINDQISDWVQSFADHCYVCNQNDNEPQLLVCDKCNFNICHTYCCGLQSIPEDEWFCQECLVEMEEQEKRKKLIAERRRKTRLQNQAKKRKMMEEEIGGSDGESSTESQEHQDDITAKLKQSDIYNESDEDDHIIKPLWRKPSSQTTTEVNDTVSRKQVLESKFAKKKRFTSSLIPEKKENQETKRINTSSLEMLRGQNQKREDQWLQAEQQKDSKTQKNQFQPQRMPVKKPQNIQKPPPSTCLMMVNPSNALNTYIPPFKTTKFGNSLKLTAAPPPRDIYDKLLQPKSNTHEDPAAKVTFRKSKSLSEESNDAKISTGHSDDLPITIIEDQKEQPPKLKKKGISFKDPTPQKQQPKVISKIPHDFDIFEIMSPQKKPSIQIVAGTSSAGKATYANLIDSSNIINGSLRYQIQQQQQLQQKKITKPIQHQSEQPSQQPKKKKQQKKRAKKNDDEVEEVQPKNKKGLKKGKKVEEKEQVKKKPKKVVDLSDEYNCTDQEEDEVKDDTYDSDENLEDEIVPSSKKRMQKRASKERQRGNKRRIEEESD